MLVFFGMCGEIEERRSALEVAVHLVLEDLDADWAVGISDTEGEDVR